MPSPPGRAPHPSHDRRCMEAHQRVGCASALLANCHTAHTVDEACRICIIPMLCVPRVVCTRAGGCHTAQLWASVSQPVHCDMDQMQGHRCTMPSVQCTGVYVPRHLCARSVVILCANTLCIYMCVCGKYVCCMLYCMHGILWVRPVFFPVCCDACLP